MNIKAIKESFVDEYSIEAIKSINDLDNELGLQCNGKPLKLFNIQEAFDVMYNLIKGYTESQIKALTDKRYKQPPEVIRESVYGYIHDNVFHDEDVKYGNMANFVESYIIGYDRLDKLIQESTSALLEHNVDNQLVGFLTEFADWFVEELNPKFESAMDLLLITSGYKPCTIIKNDKLDVDFI